MYYTPTHEGFSLSQPFCLSQADPKAASHRSKTIQDPVYGQVVFPPALCVVLDTPQVQRLRGLKQLGTASYVYPSATHTRFEHSIGAAHLAMELFRTILANHDDECVACAREGEREGEREFPETEDAQEEKNEEEDARDLGARLRGMTHEERQRDLACLGIAGLCHDLGHGPLSHMFERHVASSAERRRRHSASEGEAPWHHEDASAMMLEALWEEQRERLAAYRLDHHDLAFVKLLIGGLKEDAPFPAEAVGRPVWKRFMTDIVANKRSGLDVDKCDYLLRDGLYTIGHISHATVQRVFQSARVMWGGGGGGDDSQICYSSKMQGTIEELFAERFRMHKLVYLHRVALILNEMVLDALDAAEDHFTVPTGDGADGAAAAAAPVPLSLSVRHPGAYLRTGDWVLDAIRHSSDPRLAAARAILDRVARRELYVPLGALELPAAAPLTTTHEETNRRADVSRNPVAAAAAPVQLSHADKLRRDILEKTHPEVRQQLEKWEAANGLPGLCVLRGKATMGSSDLPDDQSPVTHIGFYNPRHSPEFRSTTAPLPPTEPPAPMLVRERFYPVARAQLPPEDLEHLRAVVEGLSGACGEGDDGGGGARATEGGRTPTPRVVEKFSATPQRTAVRSVSRASAAAAATVGDSTQLQLRYRRSVSHSPGAHSPPSRTSRPRQPDDSGTTPPVAWSQNEDSNATPQQSPAPRVKWAAAEDPSGGPSRVATASASATPPLPPPLAATTAGGSAEYTESSSDKNALTAGTSTPPRLPPAPHALAALTDATGSRTRASTALGKRKSSNSNEMVTDAEGEEIDTSRGSEMDLL